jgi:hypothetical protein
MIEIMVKAKAKDIIVEFSFLLNEKTQSISDIKLMNKK